MFSVRSRNKLKGTFFSISCWIPRNGVNTLIILKKFILCCNRGRVQNLLSDFLTSSKHVLVCFWLSSSWGRSIDDELLNLALMPNYSQSTFMWTVTNSVLYCLAKLVIQQSDQWDIIWQINDLVERNKLPLSIISNIFHA